MHLILIRFPLSSRDRLRWIIVASKTESDVKRDCHSQFGGGQLPWIPPLDLTLGSHRYALGRRKWKIQGGYPHLQHGGLSLLEMFVPFIEIQCHK